MRATIRRTDPSLSIEASEDIPMPEQPPDPRHYDMRIPPPADANEKQDSQTSSDRSDTETDAEKETGLGSEKFPPSRSQR